MWKTFSKIFSSKDLQDKIMFTIFIILIYRFGSAITVPFINAEYVKQAISDSGSFLNYLDVLSGGGLQHATIFAMSISPYINSSIIVQLLTFAVPKFEKLQKEGEFGRKKLTKITRYLTMILAVIQASGYYVLLRASSAIRYVNGLEGVFAFVVIVVAFTAGAVLIVWLGERVSDNGLGNGVSIILFAGIVSRVPDAVASVVKMCQKAAGGERKYLIFIPAVIATFFVMILVIVVMHLGERKIPIQYAKRVVGRKMFAGQSAYLPIKISMSGVMPIIFASCILGVPDMINRFMRFDPNSFAYKFCSMFQNNSLKYALMYFILIVMFNYFYISVQYNPVEISNNLIKSNGSIPGIRPGKPTVSFISKVLWRIATFGAFILATIAVSPIFFAKFTGENLALGGTSIIIIVGVALETVRVIGSQITMQKHKGFLE